MKGRGAVGGGGGDGGSGGGGAGDRNLTPSPGCHVILFAKNFPDLCGRIFYITRGHSNVRSKVYKSW